MRKLEHRIGEMLFPILIFINCVAACTRGCIRHRSPGSPWPHSCPDTLNSIADPDNIDCYPAPGIETHKLTQLLSEKITLEQLDEKSLELIDFELRKLVDDDFLKSWKR